MSIPSYSLRAMLVAFCLLPAISLALGQTGAPAYTMGPEDKLKVHVVDWRTGTYDTHEWPALTGEFTVSASGTVSLPIVGDLQATGKTTTELATSIAVSLRQKVGLAQEPYASVEVTRYRPFYVIGSVGKPGEYPYRPGLTVLQAVGVSSGFERPSEANLYSLEREILTTRGDIHVLEVERLQGFVKEARIDAELEGADAIHWPSEAVNHAADQEVAKAMKDEAALLAAHNATIRAELKSAEQNKGLLTAEIKSLSAKGEVLGRQEGLTLQELQVVSSLVARGLAGSPRQIALQQNQAQFQSTRLDLELTSLKTNQDIVRLDRDSVELLAKDRSQLLAEKSELRIRLASVNERIAGLRTLVRQAEARAPFLSASLDGARLVTTYTLTRETKGEFVRKTVTEDDLVAPGDTLRVEQHREELGALASSIR